ncbi:hypothetical protein NFI96_001793 [Prochilodus magdalenae]|nr:hypothetical protein NFI96_001793 [Prochilodus magdalenae]
MTEALRIKEDPGTQMVERTSTGCPNSGVSHSLQTKQMEDPSLRNALKYEHWAGVASQEWTSNSLPYGNGALHASSTARLEPPPLRTHGRQASRLFPVMAPRWWNELAVRTAESLAVFKRRLKTHLFAMRLSMSTGLGLPDTPEKQTIEKAYEERQKKLAQKKKNSKEKGQLKKKAPKRKIIDSSSEESDVPVPLDDDESSEDERSDHEDTDLNVGDFVLVNFATKHRSLRYVGMVEKVEDNEILTQFLRRIQGNKNQWERPTFAIKENDVAHVPKEQDRLERRREKGQEIRKKKRDEKTKEKREEERRREEKRKEKKRKEKKRKEKKRRGEERRGEEWRGEERRGEERQEQDKMREKRREEKRREEKKREEEKREERIGEKRREEKRREEKRREEKRRKEKRRGEEKRGEKRREEKKREEKRRGEERRGEERREEKRREEKRRGEERRGEKKG